MRSFLTTALLLLSYAVFAQDTGRMETDRPDQTESPFITKKKYIQAEFGFNIEKNGELSTIVIPTTLIKYGVCKRLELRLITQVNSQETPILIPQGNHFETGLIPVQIGGKVGLWEEKGLLPKTGVVAQFAFPKLASKYFQASKIAPEFRLAMQNSLSDKVGLGYNIGAEWDGESNTPSWIYTIGPGFNLGKNGYMYVELFGDFKKNTPPEHNFDAGFAYYLSDNTKLDISSGISLSNSNQYYVAVGFSFRFKAF
jgi:hypothetical protein